MKLGLARWLPHFLMVVTWQVSHPENCKYHHDGSVGQVEGSQAMMGWGAMPLVSFGSLFHHSWSSGVI